MYRQDGTLAEVSSAAIWLGLHTEYNVLQKKIWQTIPQNYLPLPKGRLG
jgi:hypothetical protein